MRNFILLFNYREDRENGGLNLKDFNSTVTHESKHKDDFENGVMKYELNYIDSYRRLNHLEIAANLASVLSMRHEYLSDPEGFTCGNGGLETFFKEKYIKAIETGEITANSSNPEKFDEEMKFLFDGTKAVWEEKARKPHYHKVHMNSAALQYVSEDKSKVDFNSSENMDEVLNIIYNKNLGGVNFLKYLNKEDDLNLSLSEKQELNDAANYAEYTYSDEVNRDYRGGSEAWKNKSTENNYFINGEMSWMGFKRVSDPQNITIYNLAEPVIIESVSKEGDNSLQNKIMQAALLKNNER